MIVMPANSTGWFWHSLARETGRIGHLYSPGAQRGPWPWFPYALDNGAFSCWNPKANTFDDQRWNATVYDWRNLIFWASASPIKPLWAIVPDVPGNASATIAKWAEYADEVKQARIPLAVAVQDGMEPVDVKKLLPAPEVVCVGGSTEWKWATAIDWCKSFERVHVLRCNSPDRLKHLESIGCESTDGTGWNRGDRVQTAGIEAWARQNPSPTSAPLWPHVCRSTNKQQMTFA